MKYPNLSYGKQTIRTEQNYSGGWVNDARLTYKTNAMGWQNFEEREEYSGSWASKYDITQTYDKVGNRASFHKNTVAAGTYGRDVNLSYNYDVLNRPTTMTDSDQSIYTATFTTDGNGNITQLHENTNNLGNQSDLYNYYDIDDLNRVTANRVKYFDGTAWQWIKRVHEFSATGAILQSTHKTWADGGSEPAGDSLLHSWDQSGKHVQNTDTGGTTFGKPWHWAGGGLGPLKNPNADTASQNAYNLQAQGGAGTPSRRSYTNPTTAGDARNLWGQGQPNAKDSNAAWATARTTLVGLFPGTPVESRFEFEGTVAPTDLDRATDSREKGRVGIFGSGYSLAGSSPRMTSETIGRDINPLGRGDGMAYVGGMVNLGRIAPVLPTSKAQGGQGSSVNNPVEPSWPCDDLSYYDPPQKILTYQSSDPQCSVWANQILSDLAECYSKAHKRIMPSVRSWCEEYKRLLKRRDQILDEIKKHQDTLGFIIKLIYLCRLQLRAAFLICMKDYQICTGKCNADYLRHHNTEKWYDCLDACQSAKDMCEEVAKNKCGALEKRRDEIKEQIKSLNKELKEIENALALLKIDILTSIMELMGQYLICESIATGAMRQHPECHFNLVGSETTVIPVDRNPGRLLKSRSCKC